MALPPLTTRQLKALVAAYNAGESLLDLHYGWHLPMGVVRAELVRGGAVIRKPNARSGKRRKVDPKPVTEGKAGVSNPRGSMPSSTFAKRWR